MTAVATISGDARIDRTLLQLGMILAEIAGNPKNPPNDGPVTEPPGQGHDQADREATMSSRQATLVQSQRSADPKLVAPGAR